MKKTTKGILSALLLTAMCGAVGCKPVESSTSTPSVGTSSTSSVVPETVEDVNLVSRLADGGQGVYTVADDNGKASVSYTKNSDEHKWAFVKADITDADKMDKMNTLKFALSGVGTVIIKLEGAAGAVEVKLLLSDVAAPYELNLLNSKDKIGTANKVVIFAAPDSANATGSFVVEELTLTANDPDNYIVNPGWSNIDPNSNVYDGVADTFSFNKNWIDNDQVIHAFTYNDDGSVKVDYNKGAYSYAFAYAEIAGKYGAFPYITFKVQGTAGEAVLFKVEPTDKGDVGNKEITIDFDGTVQTVTLDLSAYTEAQRSTISRVLMFGAPGVVASETNEAKGSYTVHAAYFTHEYEGEKPVVYETSVYNGVDDQFGVNNYWHGDKCYTIEQEGLHAKTTVKYENVDKWSSIKTKVSGKLGNFTKLSFGIEIPVGKSVMIKVAGVEKTVEGTGAYDDTNFIDISTKSIAERNAINEILIFAEPDVAGVSGEFSIHWMKFDGYKAQANEYISGSTFNVNANWQGDTLFNISDADGKTTIAWENATNGNRWSSVYTPYVGDISNFGELEYSITLPANSAIRMSIQNGGGDLGDLVNDTNEAKTFTGYFDLSKFTKDQLAGTEKIMVFPLANIVNGGEVDVVTSGSIEISTLKFVYGRTTIGENGVLDVKAGNWYATGKGYTFTAEENGMKVSYNKDKGYWEMAIMRFDGAALADYSKATLVFTGPEGVQCIFKLEGEKGGAAEAKYEQTPMTGAEQTAELDVSSISSEGAVKFIIFADFNSSGEGISGDITIHSLTFSA